MMFIGLRLANLKVLGCFSLLGKTIICNKWPVECDLSFKPAVWFQVCILSNES